MGVTRQCPAEHFLPKKVRPAQWPVQWKDFAPIRGGGGGGGVATPQGTPVQRPSESVDPTQHAKGGTRNCTGPRKETATRRNVTRGLWGTQRFSGLTPPSCGPPLILPPARKRWGPPGGRGYVATLPTCGPPPIPSPALKRWGAPRGQGLCSHLAHLWATSDSALRSEAVGTPQAAGVM